MQFADDADLAEALASPNVVIKPLLEFDWDRDGTYSHDYSNMSKIMSSMDVDSATFQGDLPSDINAAVGSSSGQATIILQGRRNAEELTAAQLFNRYFAGLSPLNGYRHEGTPIRYSRKVRTKYGFRTIRQFTGWVSEIPTIDEETGEVQVICSDVYDLQTAPVTLPRWGVGPSPENSNQAVNGDFSYSHPIETTWVLDHLLLVGGRSRGPSLPDDIAAYWSCAGSFLPSQGTIVDTVYSQHAISYENADAWIYGQNGALAPKATTHIDNRTLNQNFCRTRDQNGVPENTVSADPPQWTELSCWAYSDGSGSTSSSNTSQFGMRLDSASSGITPGYVAGFVNKAGVFSAQITESPSISGARTWNWKYNTPQATGWHYYSAIISWTYNGISAVLRVDDAVVSATVTTPGASLGFRYQTYLQNYEFGNVAYIQTEQAPIQFVMIRHSPTAIVYDPNQKAPVTRDGYPLAQISKSANQLVFIPDVTNKMVWDVWKAIVTAELGVTYTDEYGWLHFIPREYIYLATDTAIASAVRIPRNKLGPLKINPSANLYRNAVSMTTVYTGQIRANVWTNDDPKEFYTLNGANSSEIIDLPDDMVTTYLHAEILSYNPPDTGVPLNHNYVASVRADDTTLEPATGIGVNVIPQNDQRTAIILWANSSGFPVYIGAYKDANTPAWFLNGTKLAPRKNGKFLYTNEDEINEVGGVRLIEIPPSDWLQGEAQSESIGLTLLGDTVNPAPLLDPVDAAVDPRRQLGDFVVIDGKKSVTGDLTAQIIGKHITDKVQTNSLGESVGSFNDKLMLRVARTPAIMRWDIAGVGWDQGVWDT